MKRIAVFAFWVLVVIGSSVAQSMNNDAQRLVGTWTAPGNITWVFNANGTGTTMGSNFIYGVSVDGSMFFQHERERAEIFKFYMSPDGSRLIFRVQGIDIILQKR